MSQLFNTPDGAKCAGALPLLSAAGALWEARSAWLHCQLSPLLFPSPSHHPLPHRAVCHCLPGVGSELQPVLGQPPLTAGTKTEMHECVYKLQRATYLPSQKGQQIFTSARCSARNASLLSSLIFLLLSNSSAILTTKPISSGKPFLF